MVLLSEDHNSVRLSDHPLLLVKSRRTSACGNGCHSMSQRHMENSAWLL